MENRSLPTWWSPEAPSCGHSQDIQGENTKQRFGAFKKPPKETFHGTCQILRVETWTDLPRVIPPLLFEKPDAIPALNLSPSKICAVSCTSQTSEVAWVSFRADVTGAAQLLTCT